MVIRDLRVYAQSIGASVFQYRDSNGMEADAVIEMDNGDWASVEVKLGFGAVDEAAAAQLAFLKTIDTSLVGQPKAQMIVTGAGFAHRRNDGVYVLPYNTLKP